MKTIEYSISEADAVRHLIVCDTQFTWAGVTNLTMPQMMDLQARGWVVEGDDNDEFQLTEAGEEVVARALQHGVPKTLADVQPGGRVRLGDQAFAQGCDELRMRTEGERAAYLEGVAEGRKASLSAQPSPGGQGDAREQFETWATSRGWSIQQWEGGLQRYCSYDTERMWEAFQAALAARQPVGEKEVVDAMVDKAWNRFEVALNAEDGDTPEDRVLSETIDQRDRYHEVADDLAGHIAAITGVEIGEHSSANCPWQNAIEAAEEYKPTQAVDLRQFRALAAFGEEFAFSAEKQPQSRVIYGQANRLLALIDSQAVGNG